MIFTVKSIHLMAVTLSLTGFVLRGWWAWRNPALLASRWVRTLPHLNDTVLLVAGITLLWLYRWWPGDHPWLLAKLAALLAYIGLGASFFRMRNSPLRLAVFFAAVSVFLYIIAVALTKKVWPF